MKYKTRGIALHRINYSDSSIIVQVLTKDFGVKSYIIKGASGKKSASKKALFMPLNILDLEVSHTGREKIEMIYESRNNPVYSTIHSNIYKSCIAQFVAELLLKSLREENIDETMYEFIEGNLLLLDKSETEFSSFHLAFALGLTRYIGFYPADPIPGHNYFDLAEGVFTFNSSALNPTGDPTETILLKELMDKGNEIKLDRESRKKLLHLLMRYYALHVPAFKDIKSLQVLEEVLA